MEVLVFKTNIRFKTEVQAIQQYIGEHPGVIRWNVDLKDCDRVLRIVSKEVEPVTIESMIQKLGYVCEELKD